MPEFRHYIATFLNKLRDLLKMPYYHVITRLRKVVGERKMHVCFFDFMHCYIVRLLCLLLSSFQYDKNGVKDFIQLLLEAETTSDDFEFGSTKIENMQNLNVQRKLTSNVNTVFCLTHLNMRTLRKL